MPPPTGTVHTQKTDRLSRSYQISTIPVREYTHTLVNKTANLIIFQPEIRGEVRQEQVGLPILTNFFSISRFLWVAGSVHKNKVTS